MSQRQVRLLGAAHPLSATLFSSVLREQCSLSSCYKIFQEFDKKTPAFPEFNGHICDVDHSWKGWLSAVATLSRLCSGDYFRRVGRVCGDAVRHQHVARMKLIPKCEANGGALHYCAVRQLRSVFLSA